MPAARQRSRSPTSAPAVIAMIGSPAAAGLARRISSVAVKPSITGMWQSISTAA